MGLVEKFGKPRSLNWCCLACESTSLLKGQKAGAIEVLYNHNRFIQKDPAWVPHLWVLMLLAKECRLS